jgi:ketosteroid isomerase-like protein
MPVRDPIHDLLAGYGAAVSAHDVDAFVALYDDEVRIFDMWGRWSYDGLGEWRQVVAEWFGSVGGDEVAVEFSDVGTVIGDGVGAARAIVTFRGLSPEGEELRSIVNRLTWVVRRTPEGAWKIVHEHTSAPIDLETLRAMPRA